MVKEIWGVERSLDVFMVRYKFNGCGCIFYSQAFSCIMLRIVFVTYVMQKKNVSSVTQSSPHMYDIIPKNLGLKLFESLLYSCVVKPVNLFFMDQAG